MMLGKIKSASQKTLQRRLVIQVTLGLFLFSFLAGIFTYQYSYKKQLELSLKFQNQIVRTIQSQAEVAAFANNEEIGKDILNGLLTNPLILGVRIESADNFKLEQISKSADQVKIDFSKGMIYPLLSPVDGEEKIGSLTVVRNNKHIRSEAAKISNNITFLMLFQLLTAALLIVLVSRKVISKPVAELAKEVVSIKPGENSRIDVEQIHSCDEIGMLSGSINALIEAVENALSESASARESAEAANRARSEFLDNSGEGFLSFNLEMLIDPEYSRECESIFEYRLSDSAYSDDKSIKGLNIGDLLFGKEPCSKKEDFKKSVELIFNETIDLKKELYISLLPQFYEIGGRHIKAKYRLIANETKMMLVLTDITREKILEQNIKNERQRLKFVIAAVRETRDFFDILSDFSLFKEKTLPDLMAQLHESIDEGGQSIDRSSKGQKFDHKNTIYEIYRNVHTFKGVFAQQGFLYFPQFLHEMETQISNIMSKLLQISNIKDKCSDSDLSVNVSKEDSYEKYSDEIWTSVKKELDSFNFNFQNEAVLEQDMLVIREFLGADFLEKRSNVVISSELASKIESMAVSLIEMMGENIDWEMLEILEQVKRLRYVDIKSLLTPHVEGTLMLAERLGKYINPFEIKGGCVEVHPDKFTPFTRSLVNVFRNALDHGIEEPDERIEADKDDYASIECGVKKLDDYGNLNNCIEITIKDDGRGIDICAIKNQLRIKGLINSDDIEKMAEDDLLQSIFLDDFSTKDCVSAMSGRGMGLSAVKTELERLNGRVEIETQAGKGTTFKFYIPI
ncbi:MAG: ATP-binding protein [Desulfamplus sp.]